MMRVTYSASSPNIISVEIERGYEYNTTASYIAVSA